MITLPSEVDLIQLFEDAPKLSDIDVPGCYNTLSFVVTRQLEWIEVTIVPSEGTVDIEWWREGRVAFSAAIRGVSRILSVDDHTALHVEYGGERLRLDLRPAFCVRVGPSDI